MRTLLFSIIFLLMLHAAGAQQHPVSLEQSKQAALAYSNAIKNGQLSISSAEAGLKAAKANYLPSVSGTGVALYGFKDIVPAIPGLLNKGISNIYTGALMGTQSIYAGGKIVTSNQLAALQVETSKILARQSADSVLLLTEQKYWNIVNLQEQSKTIKANETLLNSILKIQKDMLASGLVARNDLLKVKVQLSQLMVNKSKLNNGRMLALFDFSVYTGMPFDSLMVMQDTLNKAVNPVLPGINPDTVLSNINSYRLLALQVKSSSLQTRLTKADNLPSLSVGLSASQLGSFNGAFSSSFTPLAFGTLSIPISENLWGGNRQKVKQRKLSEQVARNNLRDGSNQLQVGILKYWYDLKDALTQISYAKDNLVQAEENLKVNHDNYKAGLNSVSDVLDAQAAYQQAEVTLNTALTDFQAKKAAYDYATGNIGNR
ncbi:TolC family protein [Mucilaginibacter paludis]|uniref:Outer membrane efflux protein n=1 Tax=Mucilaginibacter paludis DSM 18603 TaxID=714943 RepID=H1Y364_9SPHI|nr:TolC family protein [Mucilaginibacter paludis]EHQ28882.1 outer membrane efflux protein [Mucilaginibacter paludis DSM 18603]